MAFQCSAALVTIASKKFERLVQFYTQVLEQQPQPHIFNTYAEFQLSGLRLGIFKPKTTHESQFEASSNSMSLCLEVEELEKAIEHLAALSHKPSGEIIHASHGREVYLYDPDGNRLILHQST